MRVIFLLPLIYLSSFFNDLYNSASSSPSTKKFVNFGFSICISLVYGFISGLYIIIFSTTIFQIEVQNVWITLTLSSLLLGTIQVLIIFFMGESKVSLPRTYLNMYLLVAHIKSQKYIEKVILKLTILTTLLFIVITALILSIYYDDQTMVPIMLTTLSVSILISLMIINKIEYEDLKKSINQLILHTLVFVSFFSVSLISSIHSASTFPQVVVIIISLYYAWVSLPTLIHQVYQKFLKEYQNNLDYLWEDLHESYGFSKIKTKVKLEINQFKNAITHLIFCWSNGKKISVIVNFLLFTLIIASTIGILLFFKNYSDSLDMLINKIFETIQNYWIMLFMGNRTYAFAGFVVIIFASILLHSLRNLILSMRGKKSYYEFKPLLGRVLFSGAIISMSISVFPIFNSDYCFDVALGIILFCMIGDFVVSKVFKDFR